jgi:ABC-2 type transport system ATP-binding protein
MELKLTELTKEFEGERRGENRKKEKISAVDQISCTMTNGVYGLLGVNGAGKTTLMRMLCGLIHPTSGTITCNGRDIFEMGAAYRNLLGYLPQEFGFYPEFTVQDYLLYIASIKGLRPAAAKKRTGEMLSQVGLSKMAGRKMKKLSGGMKRRVGIAQAMLNDPQILILDEPTAGLDPNERIRFRNLLSELSRERLVLLSTHIVSDVEYIANEILLMQEGKLLHSGTPEEIIQRIPVKAWSVEVLRREAEVYLKRYPASNLKSSGESVVLRLLSEECPYPGALLEQLTLEDVFLYYFGEKAGEEDGLL